MKKKIAITGAKGTVGTILQNGLKGLSDYEITPIDLPEKDVRRYEQLLGVLPGHDVVIHLAWNRETVNFKNNKFDPDDALMTINVYKAALETKVPRVIMASSVHADNFYKWRGPELLNSNKIPEPDSIYGATKVFMEAAGRYYASLGLEVVCIRFGGINLENKPPDDAYIWLSHKDCVSLFKVCIDAQNIPENFLIIYGVSNNKNRIHDYANPLGWVPKDSF